MIGKEIFRCINLFKVDVTIFRNMDLISIACQEVGLDLENITINVVNDNDFKQIIKSDTNNVTQTYVNVSMNDRLNQMMPKQLSFYGDLPNTVFTDNEGKESKIIVQNSTSPPSNDKLAQQWKNPVGHLWSQSSVPKYHRRPRKSDIINSLQGAPCRKLAELQDKTSTKAKAQQVQPIIQVPQSTVEIQVQ